MIAYRHGNLLNSDADYIVHQVNCMGVMGGGIASQIRKWCPEHFDDYLDMCHMYDCDGHERRKLMGNIVVTERKPGKHICGIFGQYDYYGYEPLTEYLYVHKALLSLVCEINERGLKECTVAIPDKMCCGLAGGDWNVVYPILSKLFDRKLNPGECKITLEIWRYNGDPISEENR